MNRFKTAKTALRVKILQKLAKQTENQDEKFFWNLFVNAENRGAKFSCNLQKHK